ncbi:lambda exonuclease family protein [Polynucleobacter sp. UK-Kesae-W10]|uniref:lambda exonuclease family protein n=1 Tax=Polynucleobacter sp. UK-Kesae-W10 TaxID=1819738 RepID=UPI001C0C7AA6|nr:lambda exonuclease family protein [Polynucleobacter sp. UK-Kesae-W10]MBU3577502.1 YqaJ viral recombinase family protein [Polynucleobacter sp. UK-Kesae-W10]
MIFIDCEQGTPEWHAARAGVITASTFSDALATVGGLTEQQQIYVSALQSGCSESAALEKAKYKNRPTSETVAKALRGEVIGSPSDGSEQIAIDTAIERISGEPYGDTFQTYAMKRGSEQEAFARMRYESERSELVEECGIVLTDDRLFGYSTDGFVGKDGMIEVKTPINSLKIVRMIQTGDVSEYIHQIQGGLWITGRLWCDFIMYVPPLKGNGNDLYVKRIFRDENFIEEMETGLLKFNKRVDEYMKTLSTPFSGAGVVSTAPTPVAPSAVAAKDFPVPQSAASIFA